MTLLSALIRKRDTRKAATAFPAIRATQTGEEAGTVATIATVAVATPNSAERNPTAVPHSGKNEIYGLTLAEIKTEAGSDWPEIEANPVLLDAFARAIQVRRMREHGEVPKHYTSKTDCAHCGPVPIFEGAPDRVLGCPWCFNRRRSHGG